MLSYLWWTKVTFYGDVNNKLVDSLKSTIISLIDKAQVEDYNENRENNKRKKVSNWKDQRGKKYY